MKAYKRKGKYYRMLRVGETIRKGDMLSWSPVSRDFNWEPASSSIGDSVDGLNHYRSSRQLCALRPIDSLIYHMIKAKKKAS